jgi:predicted ATPase/DNA-binding CsgD family transcriptional regulator
VILSSLDEVFIGRSPELAEMERALGKARAGSGVIVILAGEAGIGKTRTAEVFAERARAQGACVLWGYCYEGEECPPFGPWTAALRQYLNTIDRATLRDQVGEGAADIAGILPELRRRFPDLKAAARLPAGDGEQRLYHSLFSFFKAASLRAPLLVILDNLHLADTASLKFLRHFAHELAAVRVIVLCTHRNPWESRQDPLAMTLEELSKVRGCPRLQLEGLNRRQVEEFFARALPVAPPPAMTRAIHSRTEGNPLFLVELARQMIAESANGQAKPGLPMGIKQAIARRLSGLSGECREVLSAAAVLGRSFERDVLRRMFDGPEWQVIRALQEALAASVVCGDPAPEERYRFSHALVQESLLEEIPLLQRPALHLRAGLALQEPRGTDPAARAVEIISHLLEAAGHADPDDLVLWTLRAWEHSSRRYAPQQAVAIIDRARISLESSSHATDRRLAPLLFRRGQALNDLQRPEEARESMVRAFDLFLKAGDTRGALEVAFTPAWVQPDPSGSGVWFWSGAPGGMPELRERAFALVAPESSDHARLLAQRGTRADLQQALALARRNCNLQLEAISLAQLAYHELLAWDFKECTRILSDAVPLAERLQDLAALFSVHYSRFLLGMLTGDPSIASSELRSLFEVARHARSQRILVVAHRCAADLAHYQGRWPDARMHGAQALKLLVGTGSVFNRTHTLSILLAVELQTGHLKAARKLCVELSRAYGKQENIDIRSSSLGARLAGDPSLLPPIPQPVEVQSTDGPLTVYASWQLIETAQAIVLRGDLLSAPCCLEALRRWKAAFFDKSVDGLMALLCDLLGRRDEAVEHFENALSFCRRAGYWPEFSWTCLDYAEALSRSGVEAERERALPLLEEGLQRSQTLDMTPLSRLILTARARLTGATRSHRAFPDGLTKREVDVLRLMAKGFTNAEIANRLFISQLTVATHVHNLLDKTGMANRAEAAAYATRCGLVGQ